MLECISRNREGNVTGKLIKYPASWEKLPRTSCRRKKGKTDDTISHNTTIGKVKMLLLLPLVLLVVCMVPALPLEEKSLSMRKLKGSGPKKKSAKSPKGGSLKSSKGSEEFSDCRVNVYAMHWIKSQWGYTAQVRAFNNADRICWFDSDRVGTIRPGRWDSLRCQGRGRGCVLRVRYLQNRRSHNVGANPLCGGLSSTSNCGNSVTDIMAECGANLIIHQLSFRNETADESSRNRVRWCRARTLANGTVAINPRTGRPSVDCSGCPGLQLP